MTKARNIASANPAPTTVSTTELGYVDGVTSAIQTQLDAAIPKSTVTAKGSIVAATASSTPANLAVGNNGETLVADSTTATGLRYQDPVNANPVLNSAFQVWQRGVTGTANSAAAGTGFNADRWQNYSNGNALTISRQLTNDTTNLPNIQYCARVQRNAGQTSLNGIFHVQNFESINAIPYAGKTVTFSFYARKGANYSEATSTIGAYMVTGTGTDQNVLGTYTGFANTITLNAILTTTWQRFTGTAVIPAATKECAIQFSYTPTGTAGAADYFEVTGVQLEVGSVATPFKTNQPTIATELAACQRYYQRYGMGANNIIGNGAAWNTTSFNGALPFVNELRIAPTISVSAAGDFLIYANNTSYVPTAFSGIETTTKATRMQFTVVSGLTQGHAGFIQLTGVANKYLEASAEL